MAQDRERSGGRSLAFVAFEIAPGENRKRGQRPEPRWNAMHLSHDERARRCQSASVQLTCGVETTRSSEISQESAEQLGCHFEKDSAALKGCIGVRRVLQQDQIAFFQSGKFGPTNFPWKQFSGRSMQSRFRGHLPVIKLD